jgi:hypothetical protein
VGRCPRGIWLNEELCQRGCRWSNRSKERRPRESLSPICRLSRPLGSIWPSRSFKFTALMLRAALRSRRRSGATSCVLRFVAALPGGARGLRIGASWARELVKLGHDARMMPPAYVKPYIRRQKNEAPDAAAICEAVTPPSMRFVDAGVVTFAHFTCQPRSGPRDRKEEYQAVGALDAGANPTEMAYSWRV